MITYRYAPVVLAHWQSRDILAPWKTQSLVKSMVSGSTVLSLGRLKGVLTLVAVDFSGGPLRWRLPDTRPRALDFGGALFGCPNMSSTSGRSSSGLSKFASSSASRPRGKLVEDLLHV